MDRINGAGTVDIGGGRRGFRDEDLAVGQEGTEVTAIWLTMIQEEVLKVIEATGGAPSESDWTQLAKAIQGGKLNFAVAGGTANALTASLPLAPPSLAAGLQVHVLLTATNTASATFNLNGLGASAIELDGSAALRPGDLVSGTVATLTFDGTNWQLTPTNGSVKNSATLTGGTTVTLTTGSGNFTVPAGVYALDLELAASGGGGGYAAAGGAGPGGNGGNTVRGRLAVTPGQVIPWGVGVSGSGGTVGVQAQPGGDAFFGTWTAKGGTASANVGAVAGSAVSVAVGDTGPEVYPGQQAEAGFIIPGSQQWGGHGGQSAAGGFGGNGARNGGTGGNAGSAPGGGGGGGSNAGNGGPGGAGRITIRY